MPDEAQPGTGLEHWLRRPWVPLIPGVVTLCLALYRLGTPSFTRDESATLLAVHRSFPQLVQMLGNVDVVHGAYYSLIWAVTQVAGSGPFAARLPSAVAVAVAAWMIALIGARLASGLTGLAAGLVWAVLPPVSFYAEDAREYAIVAALATVASYLLIRVADDRGARVWQLVAYGATVAAMGLTNIFGLLILPAHAVTLALLLRRHGGDGEEGGHGGDHRRLVTRWLTAAVAAMAVTGPVIVAGWGQVAQVGWIKRPGVSALTGLEGLAGGGELLLVIAVAVVASVILAKAGGLSRLRSPRPGETAGPRVPGPAGLVGLAVPWLLLPPVLLLAASFVHPAYVFRYVVFCMPAVALLAGMALASLGAAVSVVALVIMVVISAPAQIAERGITGHGYGIFSADRIVARHERPGDALLNVRFLPLSRSAGMERQLEAAYPFGLSRLRDVSEGTAPAASATLGGTFAPSAVVRQRLAGVSRLWVVSWSPQPPPVAGFARVQRWHPHNVWLWLYERSAGQPG